MDNQLLHTPDGVRDLYEGECEAKLLLQNRIHHIFRSYGYRDIETPSYEFFDIFNKERGSIASRSMFKFFDRENNTMVLRPDITPGIARCAAKYYSNTTGPVRLCYTGKTFINHSSYQGRLAEATQAGCELIAASNASVESEEAVQDAEMIALLIQSLLSSGIKDFQVELGHVDFYSGIFSEAGLSEEEAAELKTIIRNKNLFMIDEFIEHHGVDQTFRDTFYALPQIFGGVEILSKAQHMTKNAEALQAIEHLQTIYSILEEYKVASYVSFDLGVMSNLNYYTGVIFRAYTYDVGEPIANGGRYDHLIAQFGLDRTSIGFGINVDLLALALRRQQIEVPLSDRGVLIVYEGNINTAIQKAAEYRNADSIATIISKKDLAAMDTGLYREVIYADI